MVEKWSKEKAWEWYNARPWIRGFNYRSSNCVNAIDQFQSLDHAEKVEACHRELALAQEWGFNSLRTVLPIQCYIEEHDTFISIVDEFLDICAKYGISVMPVFGNDCTVRKELFTYKKTGPQPVDWGYHGGLMRSPHDAKSVPEPGYSLLDEEYYLDMHYKMIKEIVTRYKNDERVIIWNIFNEIGNGLRGMLSVPAMEKFFEIARSCDPIQPLTADAWTVNKTRDPIIRAPELRAIELSDIISYHDYRPFAESVAILDVLKEFGRPLINTEWLHRMQGNKIQTHLPLFYLEKVGIYNWGWVVGKSQTHEPWEAIWRAFENGKGEHYDFTQWQHDLVRPNLRPYDPKEKRLMQKFFKFADDKFAKEQGLGDTAKLEKDNSDDSAATG
jgi:beta-galactosidase/beta-glucuronidase